ncbi:microtubule-associated tumor suppressor 1 homolog A-like [Anneissia japonica]|uniref:microtubule-associated tumor suppressor 1 homolog A-like n=1 Tax=Anneissia japonica TaxID=1529436 RepID=UPI00142566D7|nr:microtubule-associated tumor suppressor 1 homolog A-like [Anneissia japonica]
MELEKELEVISEHEEKIKRYERRIEELKAIVGRKADLERQLSSEHRALKETLDKQSTEKKRLSMENEELVWKLQQSECGSPVCLTPPTPTRTTRMPSPTNSFSRTNLLRLSSSESHDNVFMSYEQKMDQSLN